MGDYRRRVRTTITLDPDTAAAVDLLRRERALGVSAAVNELVRRGLTARDAAPPFRQRTSQGHPRLDMRNIAEALEALDGPAAS